MYSPVTTMQKRIGGHFLAGVTGEDMFHKGRKSGTTPSTIFLLEEILHGEQAGSGLEPPGWNKTEVVEQSHPTRASVTSGRQMPAGIKMKGGGKGFEVWALV